MLIQYMIQRAVSNFKDFGYDIYWALKSEARHSMCNVQLFQLILIKILQNIP